MCGWGGGRWGERNAQEADSFGVGSTDIIMGERKLDSVRQGQKGRRGECEREEEWGRGESVCV